MKTKSLFLSAFPAFAGTALYFLLLFVTRLIPPLRDADGVFAILWKIVRLGSAILAMTALGARPYPLTGTVRRRDLKTVAVCAASLCAVWAVFRFAVTILVPDLATGKPEADATAILSAVVIAPITEELFFRAFLSGNLENLGAPFACLFGSTVFAISHADPITMIYAFLCGIMLFVCGHRTRKLIYCILLHAMLNAAAIWI